MNDITFVGLDVHKATVSVTIAVSGRSREVRQVLVIGAGCAIAAAVPLFLRMTMSGLTKAGCKKVFREVASGRKPTRHSLEGGGSNSWSRFEKSPLSRRATTFRILPPARAAPLGRGSKLQRAKLAEALFQRLNPSSGKITDRTGRKTRKPAPFR